MAQNFSDWYYAISTIRVPDQTGRAPLEKACQSFAQGIVSVTRPSALIDWAHDLLERELKTIGRGLDSSTPTGGDHPNAMTQNRSPTELLHSVSKLLDEQQRAILGLIYDKNTVLQDLDAYTGPMGGTPFAALEARYALKRALRDSQQVPFSVVPDSSDMDRAPLCLYEAGRLASADEICQLEKWLLSDIDLCKDIAEFAAFVHALRGGAFAEWAVIPATAVKPPAAAKPPSTPTPAPVAAAPREEPPPAVAPEPAPEKPTPAEPSQEEPAPQLPGTDELPTEEVATPAAAAVDQPVEKVSNLKAILWTGLVGFLAVVLLLLIIVALLRMG